MIPIIQVQYLFDLDHVLLWDSLRDTDYQWHLEGWMGGYGMGGMG